jgi:hypothetical protein
MPFTFKSLINNEEFYCINFTSRALHDISLKTLIHELIHIKQKQNPEYYNNYYINKLNYTRKLLDYENFKKYKHMMITNPDGYYVPITINNKEYIYIYTLDDYFIYIKNTSEYNYLCKCAKVIEDKIVLADLDIKESIIRKFNITQIDHPNEIYAVLLTRKLVKYI